MDLDQIKEEIRAKQGRRDLTNIQLAELAGLKGPQITRFMDSENFQIKTLMKLLDALDLKIEVLDK